MRGDKRSNHAGSGALKQRWLTEVRMYRCKKARHAVFNKSSWIWSWKLGPPGRVWSVRRRSSPPLILCSARAFRSPCAAPAQKPPWIQITPRSLPSTRLVVKGKVCPALSIMSVLILTIANSDGCRVPSQCKLPRLPRISWHRTIYAVFSSSAAYSAY